MRLEGWRRVAPQLPKREQLVALEEFAEERRRFIRDADDLVRCLTIEFEIELGPGLAVIPVGEMFELVPPQRPLRERGASDDEAQARCLPDDAALLCDRFGGSDNAARDEALPALVLAREHEKRRWPIPAWPTPTNSQRKRASFHPPLPNPTCGLVDSFTGPQSGATKG